MTPLRSTLGARARLFREHGYFVVQEFLDRPAACALRRACDDALDRARTGSTAHGHTTPKIGLFADPATFSRANARAFDDVARFVSSPRVCALLAGLERAGEDAIPRIKAADYYHEQTARDWDGDWHRDSQFGLPDPERERQRLLTTTSVHVRVALEDDDRLELVPGSHVRWDTPEELRIRKGCDRATAAMPGATRIVLRTGDACVFHAWSIHRATYRRAPLRRTLDCLYAFGT
jgi:ectoine hydroxylase-related dioxygenase (phytanoyl-CoA dioxygenase family)